MEKQEVLYEKEDLYQGVKPKINVVRNNYMSAGAMIREEIIKKLWVIPIKEVN